ncbi:hypothetical protein IEQ34_010768 [Dendrobium chrysotoxum]|uniref:Uncharacterized protein n=1 Tax=Dendrobium chrysotoxum TaxID=161865 RepID=A0AAV7GVK6_DENCH|nr:hypothetical protein IEQ34_010768 [Dendrobium chrysotoxum]
MFAKEIKKENEIIKLTGLKKDECLQLLNSHAFAGSPLVAKVIGGVLKDNLDESHWRTVQKKKQFIWSEFYQFHLRTELYSSAKTSTKLFCVLLHSECGLHRVSFSHLKELLWRSLLNYSKHREAYAYYTYLLHAWKRYQSRLKI